ncbi:hypothetical protein CYY_001151 [Polysphondylium violaceum]|uniref:tRNA N(3)-methylcytidine methyltransferase n=1 Tax=Polysphondylium violaceum TaxID=133409 RepID=A0A8J4V4S8_9MYCE|nr:hypothetical protein CYY_001151 [Polysphondylium violaceum]
MTNSSSNNDINTNSKQYSKDQDHSYNFLYPIIDDAMGIARLYGYIDKESQKLVSPQLIERYEKEADRFWDKFYKKNNNNFFKDRHWLTREFPEVLQHADYKKTGDEEVDAKHRLTMFEVGCGVGNTTLPLLELNSNLYFHSFDFSQHAVKLLAQAVEENEGYRGRCVSFVFNAIDGYDSMPVKAEPNSMDLVIIIFVLSAMDPKTIPSCVDMCHKVLKPGGKVLIRDYAIDDMAQNRFDSTNINEIDQQVIASGSKNKLGDNFHVRFDGTRAYYFSLEILESLFKEKGFKTEQNIYVERKVFNRKHNNLMERKFIQSKFIK